MRCHLILLPSSEIHRLVIDAQHLCLGYVLLYVMHDGLEVREGNYAAAFKIEALFQVTNHISWSRKESERGMRRGVMR